jgi:hypothetical protein
MILYRPAFPDERARAASLCEPSAALPGDGETHCFIAVKSRPVERIVGAAFWRQRDTHAAFEWVMAAAFQGTPAETEFIHALEENIAAPSLRTTAWHETHSPAAEILTAAGFQEITRRETFTAKAAAWRKLLDASPSPDLEATPLTRQHAAETIRLLADSAFSENELNHAFATASQETPSLFDLPSSSVFTLDGEISGVCLALTNPNHTHLHITALAVHGAEISMEPAVAALLRHSLAVPSLKDLSIQRLSPLVSGSPASQPVFDHLLGSYPSTLVTKHFQLGKRIARDSQP